MQTAGKCLFYEAVELQTKGMPNIGLSSWPMLLSMECQDMSSLCMAEDIAAEGCLGSSIVFEVRFLLGLHLNDALIEVLVIDFEGISPQSKHAGFHTDSLELGCIEVI